MLELANTTLSTFRGTAANAYGDLTDVGTPYLTGIPAAVVESSKPAAYDPAATTRRIIRTITATVPSWADIDADDTIKNDRTGDFYMVENIETQPALGSPSDCLILTLRARSGVDITTD